MQKKNIRKLKGFRFMDNDFLVLSQDEQKRLEYTAHQKALYDYNTLAEENFERGVEQTKTELIEKMKSKGYTDEQIRDLLS